MKLNSYQQSLIDGFNRDKVAFMYAKDFPCGYNHKFYPPVWAQKLFENNPDYLPIPLNGSRLHMFSSHKEAILEIFERAMRRFKITIFYIDHSKKTKESLYRAEIFEDFMRKFSAKFFRRYPRQRIKYEMYWAINYINGEIVYLYDDELLLKIEDQDRNVFALLMCESVIKKINTLEKLTKK